MGGMAWALIVSLILFSVFMIFFYSSFVHMLFCLFAIFVYSFFIVYDTQLIAGGRYAELTYDDYILGSIMLYIDIIGLFLYILSLIGNRG
jgi:FtsH-binding integral membrane protein